MVLKKLSFPCYNERLYSRNKKSDIGMTKENVLKQNGNVESIEFPQKRFFFSSKIGVLPHHSSVTTKAYDDRIWIHLAFVT